MKPQKKYPLHQSPLYRMQSRKKLASEIFNVDLSLLERIAAQVDNFRVFHIAQGTKQRQVETPKPILESIHRRLFSLFDRIEKPAYLHSGVKGRSYITNAREHTGLVPLVKLDIKKFYPSVDAARVYRFFHMSMRCSPDVAGLLTKLCVYDNHIPTGSCVSQLLAYYSTSKMFEDLSTLAQSHAVKFTLYVDDMTFSGKNATPAFLWEAKKIVHSHGMQYHKDRIYASNMQKVVTGILVNAQGITVLPSKELDIWKQFQDLSSGNSLERRTAIESLLGRVIAAGQIEKRLLIRAQGLRKLYADTTKSVPSGALI